MTGHDQHAIIAQIDEFEHRIGLCGVLPFVQRRAFVQRSVVDLTVPTVTARILHIEFVASSRPDDFFEFEMLFRGPDVWSDHVWLVIGVRVISVQGEGVASVDVDDAICDGC